MNGTDSSRRSSGIAHTHAYSRGAKKPDDKMPIKKVCKRQQEEDVQSGRDKHRKKYIIYRDWCLARRKSAKKRDTGKEQQQQQHQRWSLMHFCCIAPNTHIPHTTLSGIINFATRSLMSFLILEAPSYIEIFLVDNFGATNELRYWIGLVIVWDKKGKLSVFWRNILMSMKHSWFWFVSEFFEFENLKNF